MATGSVLETVRAVETRFAAGEKHAKELSAQYSKWLIDEFLKLRAEYFPDLPAKTVAATEAAADHLEAENAPAHSTRATAGKKRSSEEKVSSVTHIGEQAVKKTRAALQDASASNASTKDDSFSFRQSTDGEPPAAAPVASSGAESNKRGKKVGGSDQQSKVQNTGSAGIASARQSASTAVSSSDVLETLVHATQAGSLAAVVDVWNPSYLRLAAELAPHDFSHPLHMAIRCFNADAVALFVAAGMRIDKVGSVTSGVDDNLAAFPVDTYQNVTCEKLYETMLTAHALERGRSVKLRGLKTMAPFLRADGVAAAMEHLRSLAKDGPGKKKAVPGLLELLDSFEPSTAASEALPVDVQVTAGTAASAECHPADSPMAPDAPVAEKITKSSIKTVSREVGSDEVEMQESPLVAGENRSQDSHAELAAVPGAEPGSTTPSHSTRAASPLAQAAVVPSPAPLRVTATLIPPSPAPNRMVSAVSSLAPTAVAVSVFSSGAIAAALPTAQTPAQAHQPARMQDSSARAQAGGAMESAALVTPSSGASDRSKEEAIAAAKARIAGLVNKIGGAPAPGSAASSASTPAPPDAAAPGLPPASASAPVVPATTPAQPPSEPAPGQRQVTPSTATTLTSMPPPPPMQPRAPSAAPTGTSAAAQSSAAAPITATAQAAARARAREEAAEKSREEIRLRTQQALDSKRTAVMAAKDDKAKVIAAETAGVKQKALASIGGTLLGKANAGSTVTRVGPAETGVSAKVGPTASRAIAQPASSTAAQPQPASAANVESQAEPTVVATPLAASKAGGLVHAVALHGMAALAPANAVVGMGTSASLMRAAIGAPVMPMAGMTNLAATPASAAAPAVEQSKPPSGPTQPATAPTAAASSAPPLTLASLVANNQLHAAAAASSSSAAAALAVANAAPASPGPAIARAGQPVAPQHATSKEAPSATAAAQGHSSSAAAPSPGTLLFGQPVGVIRPGDDNNYEMSDREGSSDDDEDEDDGRPKKRIPDWAHGPALAALIHSQFGEQCVDPDTIFPEVQTCDLEAIFRNKRPRFRNRTSSGNWMADRLTHAERHKYRTDMGFNSTTKE